MQKIKFIRTNGNVPKSPPGQDHISGYIAYVDKLPVGFTDKERIQPCSSIEMAEKLGISNKDTAPWEHRVLHHHLSEVYRINPGVSLYVGLFAKPTGNAAYTFAEIKTLQTYAGGALRQVAVWCGHRELTAGDLTTIQGVAGALEEYNRPLSVGYAPKVTDATKLPRDLAGGGKCRVSVIAGQAGRGTAADLYADKGNTARVSVSGIGVWLGIASLAKVHRAISAVKHYPTGVDLPAFGDGTLLRDLDTAVIDALDEARYLFFVTHDGLGDSYFNDSHTMDAATSDYAYIENVRTMDKAVRGIRRALLPELGGELYVDDDGRLDVGTVEYLTLVANRPLEDMRKAGELSGKRVEIDPDQNVLATSEVEFVITEVGVGVLRRIKCKIGFATSLN